jgi:urease accessory protein
MLVLRQHASGGQPADELVLDFDRRCKTRLLTRSAAGEEVGVMLPPGSPPLRHGDLLLADDGRCVRVVAAAEPLLHVACHDAVTLARAAYHLGNRHVTLQLGDGWLRLPEDHVLQAMLDQLGASTCPIEAPFQPEHGAYGGGHHHSHHGDAEFNYGPRLHQFGVRL